MGVAAQRLSGTVKPEVLHAATNQYSQRSSRKYPEKITSLSQNTARDGFDCKRAAGLLSVKCREAWLTTTDEYGSVPAGVPPSEQGGIFLVPPCQALQLLALQESHT